MIDEVTLLGAESVLAETVKRVWRGERRIAVTGRPSAGKSTVLDAVGGELATAGWRLLRTHMPAGDDAGPVAMSLLAEQIGGPCLDAVRDVRRSWSDKLEEVVRAVTQQAPPPRKVYTSRGKPRILFRYHEADRARLSDGIDAQRGRPVAVPPGILLTIDDPFFERADAAGTMFSERATELVGRLSSLDQVTVVVASSVAVPRSWGGNQIELRTCPVASSVLTSFARSAFANAAEQVRALGERLRGRSPAELRMLVAIEARRGRAQDALASGLGFGPLVEQALDDLGPAARQGLRRAAVMRTPFDDEALGEFFRGAADDDVALVRAAFLQRSAAGWVLPEIVATAARTPRAAEETNLDRAHETAARFHARAFNRAAQQPPADQLLSSIRHELEEAHHLTQAGDAASLAKRAVFFVDYYDAMGKHLGQEGVRAYASPPKHDRLLRLAVKAYERALQFDPNDAYAHHYLAYNVDLLASDPARAERHYQEALRIQPAHVWHHGRWVSFLVTHGRMREARAAWQQAGDGLPAGEPLWLFEELHRQVARLALDRGELAFAAHVLDALSAAAAQQPWARAERRLLDRLTEAADDRLIFPSSIPVEQRWIGPHLVPEALRGKVKHWWAGRVEVCSGDAVVLRLADAGDRFGRRTLTTRELKKLFSMPASGLAAGAFLEIIQWKTGDEVIQLHLEEFEDPDLPRVIPPSDRYLRRVARTSRPRA